MAGVNVVSSKEGNDSRPASPSITFSSLLAPKAFTGNGGGWREGLEGGNVCMKQPGPSKRRGLGGR